MDNMKRLQQFFKQDKDDAAFRQAGQGGEFGEYDDNTDQWSKPLGGADEPFPGERQARYVNQEEASTLSERGVPTHTTAQGAMWVSHFDENVARTPEGKELTGGYTIDSEDVAREDNRTASERIKDDDDPDQYRELSDKEMQELGDYAQYREDESKEPERGTPEDPDRDEYWEEYSGYEPTNKSADIQKLSSGAMSALAGWWLGGSIQDAYRQVSEPTPAQQREFERQIQQAMRKKNKNLSKSQALQKLQLFFSTQTDNNDTYVRRKPLENAVTQPDAEAELLKVLGAPPFAGARFDPSSHRWVKPENFGNTYMARGGKKRIRGSGTGIHERSISGHGKGRIRGEGAGRKGKLETDLAASRRKQGFTHTDLKHPKKK